MMLEECGPFLDRTMERAVAVVYDCELEDSIENDAVEELSEAFSRLKLSLCEGKAPLSWTAPGEEASFVASLALKHVREHCAFIRENYAVFSAAARSFSLTFDRVDEAIREKRCTRRVLLRNEDEARTL